MADFRKLMLTLIAVGLLFATAASAAPYACNVTADPALTRAEGVAEMTGDILMSCGGEVPVGGILVNIRLRLSTTVTSNILDDDVTEASLILDEGLTAGGRVFTGVSASVAQNVYQAVKVAGSDTEIEWRGVVVAASGSAAYQTIRLTNVRGNMTNVPPFAQVYAAVTVSPSSAITITNNQPVVAETRQGMSFSVDKLTLKNCVEPTEKDFFTLKFTELLAHAFRPADDGRNHTIPGGVFLDEAGWQPGTVSGLVESADIGVPTQGTRLMARFKDIPDDVELHAPGEINIGGLTAEIVEDTNSNGAGGTVTGDDLDFDNGDGPLVYEITSIDAASYGSIDTVEVEIGVSYDLPGPLGTATANGTFAPLATSSQFVASASAPEPRFVDSNSGDEDVLEIGPCRTILLFPFITSQAGFDTGIAISNTSHDPLETSAQDGACTLSYFGNTNGAAMADSTQTSPSVPAGGHLVFALSGGGGVYAENGAFTACAAGECVAPLFQGYLFAMCDFQYAHGYAFISDLGAQKFAQGYLALIVPDRGTGDRAPVDSSKDAADNEGEQLSN